MLPAYAFPFPIDHTKVSGGADIANFTVLIVITDNDLRTVANGGLVTSTNGYDIAPFSSAACTTMLAHQRISYNGTTGTWIGLALVSSLTFATDYPLHIGFCDPLTTTDQQNRANAWKSGLFAYTMGDGTTLDLAENTGSYTLTNVGSATAAAGLGGTGAVSLNGTSQYLEKATGSVPITGYPATVFTLIKPLAAIGGNKCIIGFHKSSNAGLGIGMIARATDAVRAFAGAATAPLTANNVLNTTNWHSCFAVWTSATARRLSVDGATIITDVTSDGGAQTPDNITIGAIANNNTHAQFLNALIGLTIVSTAVQTDAWGATMKAAMLDYATFATKGTRISFGVVMAGTGALAAAGFAPTVSASASTVVAAGVGALSLAGFAPTVTAIANASPTASITTPANNAWGLDSDTIAFSGTGSDPEDGSLTGSSLVWTSDIDGPIGTGTSFNKTAGQLTPGVHLITLTATDSNGATGTATRTLSVLADRVIDYYADGDATLYHQRCAILPPKGYASIPTGGWPVFLEMGGSGDRSGTGNTDNDNSSQFSQAGWWSDTILANPTGADATAGIWVFLQNVVSSTPTSHYAHSWGLIDHATIPVAAGWSMNPNKVSFSAWSQGAFYILTYVARPTSRRFAAIAFASGKAPHAAVAITDPSVTTDTQAATLVASRLGQRPIRQYWSSGDGTVPQAASELFRDAELALPNALFDVPGTSGAGYFDASTADHVGTAQFMVNDSTVVPWMLSLSAVTEVLAGTGALTFTGFSPTTSVSSNTNVAAGVGALTITGLAPTVVASNHQVVAAGVGALVLAGFAPTVTASNHQIALPATGVLAATGFAPTIAASGTQTIAAGLGALVLTGNAPTVSVGDAVIVQALTGLLTATGQAPTITTSANVTAAPGAAQVVLAGFVPTVAAPNNVAAAPGTGLLLLAGFAPTIAGPSLDLIFTQTALTTDNGATALLVDDGATYLIPD